MATWEKTRERFVHLAVCWPSGGTTLHQQGYTWVFDPIDFKNAPFRIVSSLMHVSNQEVDLTIEKHPVPKNKGTRGLACNTLLIQFSFSYFQK